MGNRKISINKTVGINIFSLILLQGISFLTAPIFMRLLGTDQYGLFSLFSSRVSIITCFMGLGAAGGLAVSQYDFPNKYYEFRSSNLLLGTFLSFFIILAAVIFINPISRAFGLSKYLSVLIFITSFSLFVSGFASSAFVYEKKPVSNLLSSLSISIMNIGITFFFIWFLRKDERYLARILGYSISNISVSVILWFIIFLKKPAWLNRQYNKYAIQIGFPMVFHTLSNTVLIQSDRIMMQHLNISNSEIGIYTAYYSFSSILIFILTALNTSWCPYYYDDLKEERWDDLKVKIKRYLELFTVLLCGFLLLSREVAIVYAGEEYSSGIDILPVLSISVFFIFMYQFPVNFEMYHKKTNVIAIGTISAAAGNILLNLIGIKLWGMYGAAIATIISYIFLFTAHYIIAKNMRDYKLHMAIMDFMPWLFAATVSFFSFYLLKDFWIVRWGAGAAIGVVEVIKIKKRKSLF